MEQLNITQKSFHPVITATQIYKAVAKDGCVPIPDGWEFVDFRPPKSGEWHIDLIYGQVVQSVGEFTSHSPRLIVRKKLIKKYWLVETTHTSDDPAEQFLPYVDTKTSIRLPGTGAQTQFSATPIELTDNPLLYGGPQGAKYFRTKVRGE